MTGIRDEPMCPVCCVFITKEYIHMHLKADHDLVEVANALANVALDDFDEWKEALAEATIVQSQEQ